MPCKGYPNVCNSHGTCKVKTNNLLLCFDILSKCIIILQGNGTRKGNGLCKCDTGYEGNVCEKCAKNYFIVMKNDTLNCQKCYKSCKDGCTESGPKGNP